MSGKMDDAKKDKIRNSLKIYKIRVKKVRGCLQD